MVTNRRLNKFSSFLIRTGMALLFPLMISASAYAQGSDFQSTSAYRVHPTTLNATQMTPQHTYQSYESTIYEPFSGLTPSSSNGGNNQPSGISGRRNAFGHPENENPGQEGTEYPVGEPWVLLVFAVIAAGVVYMRNRKKSSSVLPEGKE